MMSEAMSALLLLPFENSHKLSSSLITNTTNLFSSSTVMQPEIDPKAQHNLFSRSMVKYSGFFMASSLA
jgi:hypothetical protein